MKNLKCQDCGNTEFVEDSNEIYCKRCGLIIEDLIEFDGSHEFETSHEPLSDGLSLLAEMGKKERSNNYKSSSKNKYDKLKSRYYYGILQDKLLEMGFCLSEALDIFNYAFLQYYTIDIDSNKPIALESGKKYQRTRQEVIDDFLNSLRFEEFDVSACVSRLKIPKELRESWLP